MSVYKIVIGKDMAPQKENTSHIILNMHRISHMEGFFCAPSPQAIDFCHRAICNIADNFVFNFKLIINK